MKLTFVTTFFNDFLVPFTTAWLESVLWTYNGGADCNILVCYDNVSYSFLKDVREKAPSVRLEPLQIGSLPYVPAHDRALGMANKIACWRKAMSLIQRGEHVVLMDCDTIVLKKMDHFFDLTFDIGYSWKPKRLPISSGVVLIKTSEETEKFMALWDHQTNLIRRDKKKVGWARKQWGGEDQGSMAAVMSIRKGMNFEKPHRPCPKCGVLFRGFPCSSINEVDCVPITEDTHVVHYGGAWQEVIRTGQFNKFRPRSACSDMLNLWTNCQKGWKRRRG